MKKTRRELIYGIMIVVPSIILIAIFVYGFIGNTVYVSLTDWGKNIGGLKENVQINVIGFDNFFELFNGILHQRFRQDLVNAIFYSLFLLIGAMSLGLFIAILLDRSPRGENFFRTLYIYPMALSFVVTGTIWRWLLAPNGGINVLPTYFGGEKGSFLCLSSMDTIFKFNWQDIPLILSIIGIIICSIISIKAYRAQNKKKFIISSVIVFLLMIHIFIIHNLLPPILPYEEVHGFNVATLGVIFAAIWQYSGYPMALFLAGLRGIPESLYESAKLDGASDFTYYMKIALPNMWPITFSSFIILSHISLKMFDLIFAMAGADTPTAGHPSILMYLKSFRANKFALGAAMSVILFLFAGLFIIPHLMNTRRQQRNN